MDTGLALRTQDYLKDGGKNMSKLFCGECMMIVEKPHEWTEPHGEPMSGCRCGNGLIEIEPCAICGDYPEDGYEDGELNRGGICEACFDRGIREHFMEYLETLNWDEQKDFYIGKCEGSYIYDNTDIFLMARDDYAGRVKMHAHIFGANKEAAIWKQFINDGEPDHFGAWLIERTKANG